MSVAGALARMDPAHGEAGFQRAVIELAEWSGHRVYHVSNVKGRLVNQTALGFPDLAIAGHGRLVIPELKSDRGSLSEEQRAWLAALKAVTGPPIVTVWRPSDWPVIERTLTRRPNQ